MNLYLKNNTKVVNPFPHLDIPGLCRTNLVCKLDQSFICPLCPLEHAFQK